MPIKRLHNLLFPISSYHIKFDLLPKFLYILFHTIFQYKLIGHRWVHLLLIIVRKNLFMCTFNIYCEKLLKYLISFALQKYKKENNFPSLDLNSSLRRWNLISMSSVFFANNRYYWFMIYDYHNEIIIIKITITLTKNNAYNDKW